MYQTYVLYSEKYNKIYIGFTSDLLLRLKSHNHFGKGFTARYRPWKIIYQEVFRSKKEAMKREKELKSAKGRKFIWENVIKAQDS